MPNLLSKDKNDVCIIIPAKNEAPNLPYFLPQVLQYYRVILVDNGSEDDTREIAEQLGAETVYCETKGYGIAVQTGVKKGGLLD